MIVFITRCIHQASNPPNGSSHHPTFHLLLDLVAYSNVDSLMCLVCITKHITRNRHSQHYCATCNQTLQLLFVAIFVCNLNLRP